MEEPRTLVASPSPAPARDPETIVWSRGLADEFWSGVVSPLMFSVSGRLIERRMVDKGLRIAGIPRRAPFLRYHKGRVFVNMNILRDVLDVFPSIFLTESVLAHLPATLRQDLQNHPRSLFNPHFVRLVTKTLLFERGWLPFTNYLDFGRQARRLLEERHRSTSVAKPEGDLATLYAQIRRTEWEMGEFLEVAIWGVTYAYLLYPLVRTVCDRWLGDGEGKIAIWAMGRVPGNLTLEVNETIDRLALALKANEPLVALLREEGLAGLLHRAGDVEGGEAFRPLFQDLIARHGHRLLGRDLVFRTWEESPETVLGMILKRTEGTAGAQPTARPRAPGTAGPPGELGRRSRLGPLKRLILDLGVYYMPRYVIVRENMRYFSDLHLSRIRYAALRMGSLLVEREELTSPDDVFFLFDEELEALAAGSRLNLRERVRQRRAEYAEAFRFKPPAILIGEEVVEEDEARGEADLLMGMGVSRGIVRGVARVIESIDQFQELRPGEILVTQATDPGWTCLFGVASGVVMEVGGVLSHGAILAREYGLPAVSNVTDAMVRIPTGTLIEMDGLKGEVRILKPSPEPSGGGGA